MFKLTYYHALLFIGIACGPHLRAATNLDIITEGAGADYATRYRLTYTINSELSDENRAQLEQFLSLPLAKGGLEESELAALKNNVADALIKQAGGPRGLLKRLQTDWADASQGLLWRSYIVQKIPELTAVLKTETETQASVAFLRRLALDPEPEFSATAIIGMDRLHGTRPDLISSGEVGAGAARLFAAKENPDSIRITLIQVWARHDKESALREARLILQSEDAMVLLKMAALVVVGGYGTQADNALITRYETSPEGRLSTAAASAREKYARRFN